MLEFTSPPCEEKFSGSPSSQATFLFVPSLTVQFAWIKDISNWNMLLKMHFYLLQEVALTWQTHKTKALCKSLFMRTITLNGAHIHYLWHMHRSVTASATQRLDLVTHNRWITPTVCVHELICAPHLHWNTDNYLYTPAWSLLCIRGSSEIY